MWAVDNKSGQLKYEMPEWYLIKGFTHKSIIRNNNVVNNAFAKKCFVCNKLRRTKKLLQKQVGKHRQISGAIRELFGRIIKQEMTMLTGVNYFFFKSRQFKIARNKKSI